MIAKFLAATMALVALTACGAPQQTTAQAPAALPASCDDPAAAIPFRTNRNAPEWLLVAHQRDGGDINFSRFSIRRCAPNRAEIRVQVRYAHPQLYGTENATYETTVRYTLERFLYRFDCTAGTFVIPERQIIGPNERVVATIPGRSDLWRPATPGTAAGTLMPTACYSRG